MMSKEVDDVAPKQVTDPCGEFTPDELQSIRDLKAAIAAGCRVHCDAQRPAKYWTALQFKLIEHELRHGVPADGSLGCTATVSMDKLKIRTYKIY